MRHSPLWVLATAALLPGVAMAASLSVSTASSVSSGRYGGTQTTGMATSALGVQGSLGEWQLGATLPYLTVDSADTALALNGAIVRPQDGRKRRSGYGDMTLRLERPVSLGADAPFDLRVRAQLKLPTGASSFSTGRFDTNLAVELSRTFGPITPYASAGYRTFGDRADLKLRDGYTASAGASMMLGRTILITSYERSRSPVGGPDPQELFAAASRPLRPGWSLTLYGSKGLSAGAADMMVGTAITRSF